jgi:hypothetical protein
MRERSTAVWTEFRVRFALAGAILLAAGVLVGIEHGTARIALLVLAVAVTVASLHLDAFIGVVVGLGAAAVLVGVKRWTGEWVPEALPLVAAEVSTLIVLAWVAGLLGDHLRVSLRMLSRPAPGSFVPAHSSLGLLDEAPARFRLDEELQRRSRSGEPLALMLLAVDVAVDDLDDDAVLGARRAVARHVETLLRPTDVPFALSADVMGAILPATDPVDAWVLLGPLVDSAGHATFADRASGGRRIVSDCLDLHVCLVHADDETTDGRALLDHALRELGAPADHRAADA